MIRVGAKPTPLSADVMEVARKVQPSTIGHWRDRGFAYGLRPLTSVRACVGTAFTVRLADMDATAIHCAADELEPGHVLVVDMGGDDRRASVGAILGFLAQLRGAHGIVIDGMATDLGDLEQLGIPIYAKGVSAMTTRVLGIEGDVNLPVVVGGVAVNPGDLVIADADGVLFLHPEELDELAARAVAAQEFEETMRMDIENGARLSDISGASKFART